MRKLLPDWYLAITTLVALYFGSIVAIYALGYGGFSVEGANFDFGKQYDGILFRLDATRAIRVGNHDDVVLVKYAQTPLLLCPCGLHELAGNVGLPRGSLYRKKQWLYVDPKYSAEVGAFDIETGKTLPTSALEDKGLTVDPARKLTASDVLKSFKPLSTQKESCVILLLTGYALMIIMLVIAPFAVVTHRRKLAKRG